MSAEPFYEDRAAFFIKKTNIKQLNKILNKSCIFALPNVKLGFLNTLFLRVGQPTRPLSSFCN